METTGVQLVTDQAGREEVERRNRKMWTRLASHRSPAGDPLQKILTTMQAEGDKEGGGGEKEQEDVDSFSNHRSPAGDPLREFPNNQVTV